MDMGTDTRKFYYNIMYSVYACIDIKLLPDAYTPYMYIIILCENILLRSYTFIFVVWRWHE